MSRDDGFPIADVDTGLFADPKVVALARRLRDPVQTAAHVALYAALLLESWSAGHRVPLDDAAPAWWLEPIEDAAAELHAVGLIDDERMVPEHAWDGWFGPAWDRRETRRESGRKGGLNSRRPPDKRRFSVAKPTVNPSVPPVPSVPPNPPVLAKAEPCALCGGAVSAEDEGKLTFLEEKYVTVHRRCAKADAA